MLTDQWPEILLTDTPEDQFNTQFSASLAKCAHLQLLGFAGNSHARAYPALRRFKCGKKLPYAFVTSQLTKQKESTGLDALDPLAGVIVGAVKNY